MQREREDRLLRIRAGKVSTFQTLSGCFPYLGLSTTTFPDRNSRLPYLDDALLDSSVLFLVCWPGYRDPASVP